MTLTYKKHAPPLLENYAKVFEIQCYWFTKRLQAASLHIQLFTKHQEELFGPARTPALYWCFSVIWGTRNKNNFFKSSWFACVLI